MPSRYKKCSSSATISSPCQTSVMGNASMSDVHFSSYRPLIFDVFVQAVSQILLSQGPENFMSLNLTHLVLSFQEIWVASVSHVKGKVNPLVCTKAMSVDGSIRSSNCLSRYLSVFKRLSQAQRHSARLSFQCVWQPCIQPMSNNCYLTLKRPGF